MTAFTFGIGYCLGSPLIPYVPAGRTFYWGGWGGSMIVMDLDRRLTISYMMNRMAPGHPRLRPGRELHPGRVRRAGLSGAERWTSTTSSRRPTTSPGRRG